MSCSWFTVSPNICWLASGLLFALLASSSQTGLAFCAPRTLHSSSLRSCLWAGFTPWILRLPDFSVQFQCNLPSQSSPRPGPESHLHREDKISDFTFNCSRPLLNQNPSQVKQHSHFIPLNWTTAKHHPKAPGTLSLVILNISLKTTSVKASGSRRWYEEEHSWHNTERQTTLPAALISETDSKTIFATVTAWNCYLLHKL